jgi:hypothetical protein
MQATMTGTFMVDHALARAISPPVWSVLCESEPLTHPTGMGLS